jgi:hypothetical protein
MKVGIDGTTNYCFSRRVYKSKWLELEAGIHRKDNTVIFDFEFSFNTKCDHAGLRLHLSIWKFFAGLTIYDSRHWDNEKGEWCD